jgi:hypothetical protein
MILTCPSASHLFIAIPSYDFHPAASTLVSVCRAVGAFCDAKISWTIKVEPQNAYVDDVRNILATQFLDSPATDLLFVDQDVAAREEDFLKVALIERPLAGGAYPKKTEDLQFTVGLEPGLHQLNDDGTLDVEYLPTGFLRINRAVFQSIPVETYEDSDGTRIFDFFQSGRKVVNGRRRHVTEDVDFCRRWAALGGKVSFIPNMTFDHIGLRSFSGNWATWQAEQRRNAEAGLVPPPLLKHTP